MSNTIAAIATAPGRGGVAIVRVSGEDALLALQHLTPITSPKPRFAYFTKFTTADGSILDEGVVIYFKAPHSYTGEDVVEFQGHGGQVAPQRVLKALLSLPGIRMAEPGEFTKRAFLNGKMDLTAAEAVEDLIAAGSDKAASAALASLEGEFAKRLHELSAKLTELRVRLEACLDFPEEHEDFFDSGAAAAELQDLSASGTQALLRAQQGVRLNEGARLVLAGAPNAGKSSLLNALAGSDKAIVTNIPGTTRDVLSVNIEISGIPAVITDTAGLRDNPSDEIEAIGIQRAIAELKQADLVLLMVDRTASAKTARESLTQVKAQLGKGIPLLVLVSKADLPIASELLQLLKSAEFSALPQLDISVKTEDGLATLRQQLASALGVMPLEGVYSARRRHLTALDDCLQALSRAQEQLTLGDLVLCAHELALAQESLGLITGKVTSDEILGKIFASFCIGK